MPSRLTRRNFGLVLFAVPARAQAQDELATKALRLEFPWNRYIRSLFGCEPKGETSAETCKVARRSIDRKAFEQAREAAKDVFDLKD